MPRVFVFRCAACLPGPYRFSCAFVAGASRAEALAGSRVFHTIHTRKPKNDTGSGAPGGEFVSPW